MSVIFLWARRLFCNVFPFPVCRAQLIGDWYENRRGAPNTIIFLIFRQYYWRTDAPCANRSSGPNTNKKLLAHCVWSALPIGTWDIGAPIYWHTDAPCVGRYHTEATSPTQLLAFDNVNFTLPNGKPNSLMGLAYIHANCLWTGFTKGKRKYVEEKMTT